jgi:hypothetical protein
MVKQSAPKSNVSVVKVRLIAAKVALRVSVDQAQAVFLTAIPPQHAAAGRQAYRPLFGSQKDAKVRLICYCARFLLDCRVTRTPPPAVNTAACRHRRDPAKWLHHSLRVLHKVIKLLNSILFQLHRLLYR